MPLLCVILFNSVCVALALAQATRTDRACTCASVSTRPSVAQVLQREQEATVDWLGAGTLRDLLELLDLTPIVFTTVGEGYLFDPARHEHPTPTEDELHDATDDFVEYQ